MQTVEEYLITAVADRRITDRKIKEDVNEKRRVTHINTIINYQKEELEALERMYGGRGYVERWNK